MSINKKTPRKFWEFFYFTDYQFINTHPRGRFAISVDYQCFNSHFISFYQVLPKSNFRLIPSQTALYDADYAGFRCTSIATFRLICLCAFYKIITSGFFVYCAICLKNIIINYNSTIYKEIQYRIFDTNFRVTAERPRCPI